MPRLAVLTSGGDAPGMNAAVRAIVRCGISQGFEVIGVRNGYRGLVLGEFSPMGRRDVGGIIQMGGTRLSAALRALDGNTRWKAREHAACRRGGQVAPRQHGLDQARRHVGALTTITLRRSSKC